MRPNSGIKSIDGWSRMLSKGGEIGMDELLKVASHVSDVII